ncbi:hypothetical protein LSCM1_08031 [Leishmania martiniquensis]|uniref:Uncharacterized protein n=1 Tax=Leishmania martiniquensis TaxID=1580590 RepID=A0A836I1S1_9TRYP|nr:hypothetical protein LSCM1_08031 [Leishmania martiniquensis]
MTTMPVPETPPPWQLFSSLLLLAHEDDACENQMGTLHKSATSRSPGGHPVATAGRATRLYFTEGGPSGNLTALQHYLKLEEAHRKSPLLRVLQLAPQAPTNSMQPLIYIEQDKQSALPPCKGARGRREAVLTTCSSVCTKATLLPRWYQEPVESALCVFQDFMCPPTASTVGAAAFWVFLDSILRHHAHHFSRGAIQVELQGILAPTFEAEQSAVSSVDIFDDYMGKDVQAQGHGGAAGERRTAVKVCVKSAEALDSVMAYLRSEWPRFEADLGSSHLILYAKWSPRSVAADDSSHSLSRAADATGALDQSACFVWLRNDAIGGGRDGVYADAALEALLDELSLAAASIRTPSEAAAVLQEEGLSAFFEECCLTHTLRKVLRRHFPAVVLRRRSLFSWVLSLPPYTRLRRSAAPAAVTAVRFRDNAAVSRAVRSATEMLVHWQQLYDSVNELSKKALRRYFGSASGVPRRIVSAPPRVPRHRRAIQQSGLYCDSLSSGSALDYQRGRVNVSHLYGIDEEQRITSSLNFTARESLHGGSGLFHTLRGIRKDSLIGAPLLDAEEMLASYPKLTRQVVKQVSQSRMSVHAAH